MSLKQELLEFADRLKRGAEGADSPECLYHTCLEIASELRGMTKALPDESQPQVDSNQRIGPGLIQGGFGFSKEYSHVALMQKAREEAQQARAKAGIESYDAKIVVCADGPEEGTYAPIHPEMTTGNKTRVGGSTYELRGDNKLYHFKTES